ncbi:hypothetical protein B0H11DRAFT_2371836 [Mycena galericulata]|nr:hypothetical protein B0H11DRAFT_2371836 [Mycena galericulata]
MSTEPVHTKEAPEPFSGTHDRENGGRPSDFILRSSDGVDIHVHKDILKFVSNFFDDMFAFPSGDGDPNQIFMDGKAVVPLLEPSAVLQSLVRLAYPVYGRGVWQWQHTIMSDLDGIIAVHAAAQKYQFISVQALLENMVDSVSLLRAQPHRVFAIARLWNLPELARKAAIYTLRLPLYPAAPAFPEMELFTWAQVDKLHNFHRSCALQAEKIVTLSTANSFMSGLSVGGFGSPIVQVRTHGSESEPSPFVWRVITTHTGGCYNDPSGLDAPTVGFGDRICRRDPVPWFHTHMKQVSAELRFAPSPETVLEQVPQVTPLVRAIIDSCTICAKDADRDLSTFAKLLASDVEKSNTWTASKHF